MSLINTLTNKKSSKNLISDIKIISNLNSSMDNQNTSRTENKDNEENNFKNEIMEYNNNEQILEDEECN